MYLSIQSNFLAVNVQKLMMVLSYAGQGYSKLVS